MNWNSILENIVASSVADLIIGAFVVIVVTRFFEKLSYRRNSIGVLVLIDAEIQVNKHILEDMLNEMIPNFEKQMRRGEPNEVPLNQSTFDDAARFMRIPIDNLLFGAFQSSYSGLGNLENTALLERILNLYTVSYHYRIQTSFKMEQLNWLLLDQIKGRLKKEIVNSSEVCNEIKKEIKKLRKRKIFLEALKIWEIFK